jgi:hypothetical protein
VSDKTSCKLCYMLLILFIGKLLFFETIKIFFNKISIQFFYKSLKAFLLKYFFSIFMYLKNSLSLSCSFYLKARIFHVFLISRMMQLNKILFLKTLIIKFKQHIKKRTKSWTKTRIFDSIFPWERRLSKGYNMNMAKI